MYTLWNDGILLHDFSLLIKSLNELFIVYNSLETCSQLRVNDSHFICSLCIYQYSPRFKSRKRLLEIKSISAECKYVYY